MLSVLPQVLKCCLVNLSQSPVVAHAAGAPGQVILSVDFRQSCSAEAVAVVQCLLTLDYKLRPSARQALTIPWVDQEGLDYKEHIQGLPQALASVSSSLVGSFCCCLRFLCVLESLQHAVAAPLGMSNASMTFWCPSRLKLWWVVQALSRASTCMILFIHCVELCTNPCCTVHVCV